MTAQDRVRDDVRRLVVDHVEREPDARKKLSEALDIPVVSVDRLMTKEVWDLGLALETADALGMTLHVEKV